MAPHPTGRLVDEPTGVHYRLDGIESMDPFLTTVVSSSDLWMFVSSTGGLTAGRGNADRAIFPYETDDRLHRAVGRSGPVTVVARNDGDLRQVWQPFGPDVDAGGPRSLSKHVSSHRIVFEEVHAEWKLRCRLTWEPSNTFGWVRTTELCDESGDRATYDVLDGLVDVMPSGIDALFEQIRSNLADAYKRCEVGPWGRLAVYNLESLISDRPEPSEALSATVVWSTGFPGATVDLDEGAVRRAVAGRPEAPSTLLTGRPGAYLLRGPCVVPAGGTASWSIVADTGLGHAAVERVRDAANSDDVTERLLQDVTEGANRLDAILDRVDARQRTADPLADAHHRSNVLFNTMRGGFFVDASDVPVPDLVDFVRSRNPAVLAAHTDWVAALPASVHAVELRERALMTGDMDLVRLVLEYLPLTFSRRHGDPSRPWNRFEVPALDDTGSTGIAYEGNWRDIFQNWEALLSTTPVFLPNAVAKFLNATSIEGYNAYRLARDGIEWEVPDPHDPWSHIGYWGDHQIVYLLRLIELWRRHDPTGLVDWWDRAAFAHADIPYRLADHAEMVADPRNTITYDADHDAAITARRHALGVDGQLLTDRRGQALRVTMFEKLLVPALAKLACFVPGAGLWLNTQRPEWNDANNALAGTGASVVTLFHLRRYLRFLVAASDEAARGGSSQVRMTESVAEWLASTHSALTEFDAAPDDARSRRGLLDALARAAQDHRRRVRSGAGLDESFVDIDSIAGMCEAAQRHVDATLAVSRRSDGLFHTYNLVSFPDDATVDVGRLGEMLEGQVAAISSGTLSSEEVVAVVDAMFRSGLHRRDLDSFLLYPAIELPRFTDRNIVSAAAAERIVAEGFPAATFSALFDVDPEGRFRFRSDLVNEDAVVAVLDRGGASAEQRRLVTEAYESVFDHSSFTGRSARMYGYEGIGSIYWHMVAKLLLAVQEATFDAVDREEPADSIRSLAATYRRIRDGLGFRASPAVFGAIPTDCYSHSPPHGAARQPGMTGQVKEEILTRIGELGFRFVGGRLQLSPTLLAPTEVLGTSTAELSLFGVPMTISRGDRDEVVVRHSTGEISTYELVIPVDVSTELAERRGTIERVDWRIGDASMQHWVLLAG